MIPLCFIFMSATLQDIEQRQVIAIQKIPHQLFQNAILLKLSSQSDFDLNDALAQAGSFSV